MRPVGSGLGKHLDPIVRGVDGHRTEADQTAQTMYTPISITAATACRDRQPYLICRPHMGHHLRQKFEVETQLHLHDGELQCLSISLGDDIATIGLPFDAEACGLEEAFVGRIEGGLRITAQRAIPARGVITARLPCPTGGAELRLQQSR